MTSIIDNKSTFIELYQLYADMVCSQKAFAMKVAKKYDITAQERQVLLELVFEPGASKKHIAKQLSVLMPSVTKSLERLERKGLLKRAACDKDGRVCKHFATDQGKQLVDQILEESHKLWQGALEGVSPSKIEAFKDIMERLKTKYIMLS